MQATSTPPEKARSVAIWLEKIAFGKSKLEEESKKVATKAVRAEKSLTTKVRICVSLVRAI